MYLGGSPISSRYLYSRSKMPLILRIDVDKPYGHLTLGENMMSKLREDYWFPASTFLGYLKYLDKMVDFLNVEKIPANIFLRQVTIPKKGLLKKIIENGHKIGFHAENTQTFETFSKEVIKFKRSFSTQTINSFTKHGSGELKLGRNHYPPYEPEKYLNWANKLNMSYRFGNNTINDLNPIFEHQGFFPNIFWLHPEYRDRQIYSSQWAVNMAKHRDLVVIVHPSNFYKELLIQEDLKEIIYLAKKEKVLWIT